MREVAILKCSVQNLFSKTWYCLSTAKDLYVCTYIPLLIVQVSSS